jgi:hypothetical protein
MGEKSIQNSKFKIKKKTGEELALASRKVRDKEDAAKPMTNDK